MKKLFIDNVPSKKSHQLKCIIFCYEVTMGKFNKIYEKLKL